MSLDQTSNINSASDRIQTVCNAVNLILKMFQDLLEALPVHAAVTGGQLCQQEHLMEDAVDLVQSVFDVLRQGLVFGLIHGFNTIPLVNIA